MNQDGDTIAAMATAPGEGGIAIVRISGPRSLAIADQVFVAPGQAPSARPGGSFVYGRVRSGTGEALDEVVLLLFRAPHSYTREDVVEIQGHGGQVAARRILRIVLDSGARPAGPGEFTKRAFLNGRIDLVQAEAVADLVRARSDRAASAALEQLEGRLSTVFDHWYEDLLSVGGDLEATLDFAEQDLPPSVLEDVGQRLTAITAHMQDVLETWEEGRQLREGALVVISGRPNAGKSTLLNGLLGADRAIVNEAPGTTRDTIEEPLVLGGIPIRLVDTAGIRSTADDVEREGVDRARAWMKRADVNLHVVDGSEELHPDDPLSVSDMDAGRCVVVLNKTDLGTCARTSAFDGLVTVPCSLLHGHGLPDLRRAILTALHAHALPPAHAVISERHHQHLQHALNALSETKEQLAEGCEHNEVLAANALRDAVEHLATITGRTYTQDLLETIFSKFCIGK